MLELRDSGSSRKLRHDPLLPAIPSASRGGDARIDAPQEVLGIFVTGEVSSPSYAQQYLGLRLPCIDRHCLNTIRRGVHTTSQGVYASETDWSFS
jgi:hypothetical protein